MKASGRRAQAAMEFLMTYGWAILVIGIVFAGLEPNKSVTLLIVDVAGRLVYQKAAAADSLGRYLWDTKTASGGEAASGVYIYTITGGAKPRKGKIAIIR